MDQGVASRFQAAIEPETPATGSMKREQVLLWPASEATEGRSAGMGWGLHHAGRHTSDTGQAGMYKVGTSLLLFAGGREVHR